MKKVLIALIGLGMAASVADAAWGRRSVRRERTRIFQRGNNRCNNGQCNVRQAPQAPREAVQEAPPAAPSAEQAKTDDAQTKWVDDLTVRQMASLRRSDVRNLRAKHIARIRVRYAIGSGQRGHVLQHLGYGGGRFEGCGWTTGGGVPGTCMTSGQPIADEICRGNGTTYRVRIW